MFLYSVEPSRIDQVIQCDLLHVTARTDTQKKIRLISFLPSDMPSGGGGGGVALIFSYIRRLGTFFWVQNFDFQYFWGVSEK